MIRKNLLALAAGACFFSGISGSAFAQQAPERVAYGGRSNMGGGFIEFLFGGGEQMAGAPRYQPPLQQNGLPPMDPQAGYGGYGAYSRQDAAIAAQPGFDPKYEKQVVEYNGKEAPGTLVIDTPNKFLYLVQGNGQALRYGVGVGKPGFLWSGVKTISAKREWPDWTPPAEMLQRRPDLPRHMEGGPENPLGARAMYLGSSLYRIHGSNEPWTIGTNVSSGCIRMRNEDVIDLYGRVRVGTKVIVL
ncbi:MAG: L,D-transpeptidase [Bradyrhizobiaceae bacterium]|nr:MAG: L,D-transpeptidase [Bradyrhizobiaceae bacterium]